MYRRDLLMAEIQKLSQALAKIMGLQLQGKLEEADQSLEDTLENDFGILYADLIASDLADLETFLTEKNFPSEKLDFLSQFLYLKFDPNNKTPDNLTLAEKLLLIYQILENKHHVINMINIDRQQKVQKYIKS